MREMQLPLIQRRITKSRTTETEEKHGWKNISCLVFLRSPISQFPIHVPQFPQRLFIVYEQISRVNSGSAFRIPNRAKKWDRERVDGMR